MTPNAFSTGRSAGRDGQVSNKLNPKDKQLRSAEQELEALEQQGLIRELRQLEGTQAVEVLREGRPLVSFASNDYLGLANHPQLNRSFAASIARWGSGSGSSRLLAGTLSPHAQLEAEIAHFKQAEAARCFSSGYAAAVGTLSALLEKGDTVILDKLAHASLIDGARLSGATLRVFPHNRLDKLEELLAKTQAKRGPKSRVIVVTESVFSMDGDLCPLKEIVTLKERYDAWLLLDEAHSFGIFGPRGAGIAAAEGMADRIDLQLGTFSKAAGLAGAYLATRKPIARLLTNRARSFIYSTAPPPALAAATSTSLELIQSDLGEEARTRLNQHRSLLKKLINLDSQSPIIPFILGASDKALQASQQLEKGGLLVPAVRYPTVPKNQARLRISLSANHLDKHIERLAQELHQLQKLETIR